LKSATATNPTTVTFTLNTPDATWPYVLTTGAGAIVDHKLFPPDKLLPDSQIIGSGPYVLSKYTSGQQAVFTVNKTYNGDDQIKNGGFIVQYFQQPSALKLAIEQGTVDVAYRNLSPTDIKSLQGESSKGVQVVTGNGTEIRYLVFNLKTQPGTSDAQKLAIRQAVAYTINRQDIANNVYNGTVEPLYSIVPAGLLGHTEAFKDSYGAAPDPAKAKSVLAAAGITTPVPLTIWWTPTHYGAVSADEYTEIQRQLNASGLFKVSLQSAEWQSYSKAYATDQYATYQLGWFPDFPDADDYTSPFYLCNKEFMNNHYCNQQVDKLIAQEKASTDQATRDAAFAQIQKLTATDAPLIPVWQGKQVGVIRSNVSGVQDTFDPSFTFRFWLISK
jgi:peptide/nickel transport system substrate-binding protein